MPIVLYPRLSAVPGAVQVFVGDFDSTAPRQPTFRLNGAPVAVETLRPMTSVRGPDDGVPVDSVLSRAFTGVYEIADLDPNRVHVLQVEVGAEHAETRITSLPDRVPSAQQGGFDVLLTSCFYAPESNLATLSAALRSACSELVGKPIGRRTNCTLFMGDQVYLDLPTTRNFPKVRERLAERFEADYVRNWQTALAPLLNAAPGIFLPDDHEFWNNAPHASPFIENSWSAAGREAWRGSAQTMYDAFGRSLPDTGKPGESPFIFDIEPLSFFLADGRSGRDEGRAFCVPEVGRKQLKKWVERINDNNQVGVFVTGQSLFQDPKGGIKGRIADWELPNYGDYQEVVELLASARREMIVLTGDVHWGRVIRAVDRTGRPRLYEVIVSPSSLVATVGQDDGRSGWNWVKGLFGQEQPYPRHSDAEAPPQEFGFGSARYRCELVTTSNGSLVRTRGDQLGVLSFAFDAARNKLNARVTYHYIHQRPPPSVRVDLFEASLFV